MFKDYKEIIKNLRDMQDQLWKDSMANFPGAAFPRDLSEWQQNTLENVNSWAEQAVRHSLDLQREWLDQWSERASGKRLKPKLFAELSAEARNSTQRWLDNQNQLWDQWLQVLKGSGAPGTVPNFGQWEEAVQESIQRQMSLLNDWSKLADFDELSVKQVTKLSNQISKAMQESIETQQRLWSHWFSELGVPEASGKAEKTVADTAPKTADAKRADETDQALHTTARSDDLKQISGIGAGLEKKLKDNGISTFEQIAQLSDEDIANLEQRIIRFSGRIKREKWVDQARKLVS